MNILFGGNRIRKICDKASGRLQRRLDDLLDTDNLKDVMLLPGRCHLLKADKKGLFAIDLDHPKRLLFEPANDPLPISEDGTWDLSRVTAIRILSLEDYHGK